MTSATMPEDGSSGIAFSGVMFQHAKTRRQAPLSYSLASTWKHWRVMR
jgi:hypothetical protein